MGAKATKELRKTPLGECTLHTDGAACTSPTLVLPRTLTKIRRKGESWVDKDANALLLKRERHGMTRMRSTIHDAFGSSPAIVAEDWGVSNQRSRVFIKRPAYDGQAPLSADDAKKIGVEDGSPVFLFAVVETDHKMGKGSTATWSVVVGPDSQGEPFLEPMYTATNMAAMNYVVLITTADGTPVAKAFTPGMSFSPQVEVAVGTDLAAVVVLAEALDEFSGSGGAGANAGALAGAGVI